MKSIVTLSTFCRNVLLVFDYPNTFCIYVLTIGMKENRSCFFKALGQPLRFFVALFLFPISTFCIAFRTHRYLLVNARDALLWIRRSPNNAIFLLVTEKSERNPNAFNKKLYIFRLSCVQFFFQHNKFGHQLYLLNITIIQRIRVFQKIV